jgi:hypothetical protein
MAQPKTRKQPVAGKRKRPTPVEKFMALPDAEKHRQMAEFDREFVADKARPLTAAERRRWEKARRKPGRPLVGEGVKVVSLSVEKGLLRRTDALARRRKLTRAELVAEALRDVLSRAKAG